MGTATGLAEKDASVLVGLLPGPARPRTRSVLAALHRFTDAWGVAACPEHLLDPDLIEAFCAQGLVGRATSTKGTYRSVLRRLARAAGPVERGARAPFPGARAPAPYSGPERAALVAMARAQRSEQKRFSALAVLALGIGAGLSAAEIVACKGRDVSIHAGEVVVAVRGRRPRAVPVSPPRRRLVADLAAAAGEGVVFRPGLSARDYKNALNDFCAHLVADPSAPRLVAGRCRSSFLCDHLEAGTPLALLVEIAGIAEVESLARYAAHVPGAPQGKAALRAALWSVG